MKIPRIFSHWKKTHSQNSSLDWRSQITRGASALVVGGFQPSGDLTASCFGEIRACHEGEDWPERAGKPLWPICQLNLRNAPFVPENLSDIALLQIFVSDDWWSSDFSVFNSADNKGDAFVIRTYNSLDGLIAATQPEHGSHFRPFEAKWQEEPVLDYPTHDTMPIDFDALGIGDYYEQEGIDGLHATKIGGWPSCIQSEPWWEYCPEGQGFEYALQIDSEDKAMCSWGDGGAVFIARHKTEKTRWAVEGQST